MTNKEKMRDIVAQFQRPCPIHEDILESVEFLIARVKTADAIIKEFFYCENPADIKEEIARKWLEGDT